MSLPVTDEVLFAVHAGFNDWLTIVDDWLARGGNINDDVTATGGGCTLILNAMYAQGCNRPYEGSRSSWTTAA